MLETFAVLVVGAGVTVFFVEDEGAGAGAALVGSWFGGACERLLYFGGCVGLLGGVVGVLVVLLLCAFGVGVKVRKLIGMEEELVLEEGLAGTFSLLLTFSLELDGTVKVLFGPLARVALRVPLMVEKMMGVITVVLGLRRTAGVLAFGA